jgi:hypothetical protein
VAVRVPVTVRTGTHAPATQTWLEPQVVPSTAFAPESTQTGPVAQLRVPRWQGFAVGVQVSPTVQATQVPALHTWAVPQLAPSASGVPVSAQVGPVPQVRVPRWQGFAVGVQVSPTVQATQVPALHTWSVPQLVPSTAFPEIPQLDGPEGPEGQVVVPTWQMSPGIEHWAPATQAAEQLPATQTRPDPQGAPSATAVPVSTQVSVPPEQSLVPTWQTFVRGVHASPAMHTVVQTPAWHTWLAPQVVPSVTGVPVLTQVRVPEAQL